MNFTTAVFLINDHARAVLVNYDPDQGKQHARIFKTIDPTICEGDMVVVPTKTRHGMTVVKVIAVDVDINFDDPEPVEWLVAKVDTASWTANLAAERQAIDVLKQLERDKKRQEVRQQLTGLAGDKLATLAIASM